MKAVILAGGLGTRLRTMINDRPKPMAKIAGRPFLEYQIEILEKFGIKEIIFCLYYLPEKIIDYFGDGRERKMKFFYSLEKEARGTGGAIKEAEKYLKGEKDFFVFNGDTYLEADLNKMLSFHRERRSEATIAVTRINDISQKGHVKLTKEGRINQFAEKLTNLHISGLVNGGVYILNAKILALIAPGTTTSLEKEVFPSLLALDRQVYGFKTTGLFIDIGTPQDYQKAEMLLKRKFS